MRVSKENRRYDKLLLSRIISKRGVNTRYFLCVASVQKGGVSVLRRFVIPYLVSF